MRSHSSIIRAQSKRFFLLFLKRTGKTLTGKTRCFHTNVTTDCRFEYKSIRIILQFDQNGTSKVTIPDNVLKQLQKTGCIENAAATPLKWLKSKSLLAWFVDVANDKLNLKHGKKRQIKPFEAMLHYSEFGIM
jgi:hypothetical protein